MLFPYTADDHISQPNRGACALQNQADERAEDDDDADAGECAGKSGSDNAGNLSQRQSDHNGQQQRSPHEGQEGMDAELGDGHDHEHDGQSKDDEQRNASHDKTSFEIQ